MKSSAPNDDLKVSKRSHSSSRAHELDATTNNDPGRKRGKRRKVKLAPSGVTPVVGISRWDNGACGELQVPYLALSSEAYTFFALGIYSLCAASSPNRSGNPCPRQTVRV